MATRLVAMATAALSGAYAVAAVLISLNKTLLPSLGSEFRSLGGISLSIFGVHCTLGNGTGIHDLPDAGIPRLGSVTLKAVVITGCSSVDG